MSRLIQNLEYINNTLIGLLEKVNDVNNECKCKEIVKVINTKTFHVEE